jgi:hypothetical protein
MVPVEPRPESHNQRTTDDTDNADEETDLPQNGATGTRDIEGQGRRGDRLSFNRGNGISRSLRFPLSGLFNDLTIQRFNSGEAIRVNS